jgi:hypothetical protein
VSGGGTTFTAGTGGVCDGGSGSAAFGNGGGAGAAANVGGGGGGGGDGALGGGGGGTWEGGGGGSGQADPAKVQAVSLLSGVFAWPAATWDPAYRPGVGVGGAPQSNGSDGYIVLGCGP